MKATKEKQHKYRIQTIDGPPLDLGFKNFRTLADVVSIVVKDKQHVVVEEVKGKEEKGKPSVEKEVGENPVEVRLNIVRTIEVDDSKTDFARQTQSKKTQKPLLKGGKKPEVRTTSLFLKYNKLVSLDGWLQTVETLLPDRKWEDLMWVDLSHNRLTYIGKELQKLPQLKNLYLHVNFISSFKEFENLKGAELLRTFTIHGNPIEAYPQFRALLTGILPQLQKIDSALLTKRQKQRGQVIRQSMSKYPAIVNPPRPPVESEEEDDA